MFNLILCWQRNILTIFRSWSVRSLEFHVLFIMDWGTMMNFRFLDVCLSELLNCQALGEIRYLIFVFSIILVDLVWITWNCGLSIHAYCEESNTKVSIFNEWGFIFEIIAAKESKELFRSVIWPAFVFPEHEKWDENDWQSV